MAGWDETVSSHGVWDSIAAADSALTEAASRASSTEVAAIERLKSVVSHTRSVLDNADPQLLSLNALTAIQGGLTQLRDQLTASETEEEVAALDLDSLARTVASEILDACATVAAAQAFAPEGIAQSAQSYRNTVDRLLGETNTQVAGLADQLATTASEIEAARSSFATEVETARKNLAAQIAALNESKELIATEVQEQKTRLDAMISRETEQFTTRQDERTAAWTQFLKDRGSEFETTSQQAMSVGEERLKKQQETATEMLAVIERYKDDSTRLGRLIARASTAGGFQEYADDQRKLANIWSIVTVSFLVAIAVGAVLFLQDSDSVIDTTRTAFALSLAAAATYAGRQSGHHRDNERNARQFDLETAALGPYIRGLDATTQEAIQAYMALQTFGHFDGAKADVSWTPETVQQSLNLLKKFKRDAPKEPPSTS